MVRDLDELLEPKAVSANLQGAVRRIAELKIKYERETMQALRIVTHQEGAAMQVCKAALKANLTWTCGALLCREIVARKKEW